jgi:hypothetical protein
MSDRIDSGVSPGKERESEQEDPNPVGVCESRNYLGYGCVNSSYFYARIKDRALKVCLTCYYLGGFEERISHKEYESLKVINQ